MKLPFVEGISQADDIKKIRVRDERFGNLFLDRFLPFLIFYRKQGREHEQGWEKLASTEAAYLVGESGKSAQRNTSRLIHDLAAEAAAYFGSFLLVEIKAEDPDVVPGLPDQPPVPSIKLNCYPQNDMTDSYISVFFRKIASYKNIELLDNSLGNAIAPPHYLKGIHNSLYLEIRISPFFINPEDKLLYPAVFNQFRNLFSKALRYSIYYFVSRETRISPPSEKSLGSRTIQKQVQDIDRKLAGISDSFDLLLCISPYNAKQMWSDFKKNNFEKKPEMRYPPVPVDVPLAKRELFRLQIEKVDDPVFANLFYEKQEELDRQLTMLNDRGSRRFILGGIQLYGTISSAIVRIAEELLERVPSEENRKKRGTEIGFDGLVLAVKDELAKLEIDSLTHGFRIITDRDIAAGVLVSCPDIYISNDITVPPKRVASLIQHEIGTHVVTWVNGGETPFKLLQSGLAGYEELQEGLAVFAEFMAGGLTRDRLRTLAARVLAAKALVDGATFVECFRLLCRYGFSQKSAFRITVRVYRGGGFIKDIIYLRGLHSVLSYLADGKMIGKLYAGKISMKHLPLIDELIQRNIVAIPRRLPVFLGSEKYQKFTRQVSKDTPIYDLVK